jgi:hypothetical protein
MVPEPFGASSISIRTRRSGRMLSKIQLLESYFGQECFRPLLFPRPEKRCTISAAGSRDARGFVSRRGADRIFAKAERDLRRRVRRMAREIAPRLVNTSCQEFVWIYQAAVGAVCDEVHQFWQAMISAMPTGASRGVSLVSRSDGQPPSRGRP